MPGINDLFGNGGVFPSILVSAPLARLRGAAVSALSSRAKVWSIPAEGELLKVRTHFVAVALTACGRRTTPEQEDKVAAQCAVHFAHMVDVNYARTADTQHRLRTHRIRGLLQGCPGVKDFVVDAQSHIIAIRFKRFDLRYIDHVMMPACLCEQ